MTLFKSLPIYFSIEMYWFSFSENSTSTAEQELGGPTQPSLSCLPETSPALLRLPDPHGRHHLSGGERLPRQEVVTVEASREAVQSLLHLVSNLSSRRTRVTSYRLVLGASGANLVNTVDLDQWFLTFFCSMDT